MIVAAAALILQMTVAHDIAQVQQLTDTTGSDVAALLSRARSARLQLDSMLSGYEAEVRQRISGKVGVSLGRIPLSPLEQDRLAARIESVARVGWSQQHGAWGEVLAARSVVPIVGEVEPDAEAEDVSIVLPYYPGRERLWPMRELRNALPGHADWIAHPLAWGADSIYASAEGTATGGRIIISIEQAFRYERVTALPPGEAPRFLPDTVKDIGPRTGRIRAPKKSGVENRTARCREKADSTNAKRSADSLARDTKLTTVTAEGVRVRVLLPCNLDDLITSPLLPSSIYEAGEELFPNTDFNALRKEAEGALVFVGTRSEGHANIWQHTT